MTPRIELESLHRTRAFLVREARDAGYGERRLYGRDLAIPFHGVRMPADLPSDVASLCRAYSTKAPPESFFSHTTAAQLWGIPLPPHATSRAIDVSVAWPNRAPEGRGVRGHTVRFLDGDIREVDGLRVSNPTRTWCELGSYLTTDELIAAGDFIIRRAHPIASSADLTAAVQGFLGQRGRRKLREALPLLHDRSESPQETRIRLILVRANFPGLSVNAPVQGASGQLYRADFAFLDRGLILEYQGDHHRERQQYRKDLSRVLDLQTAGLHVVLVGPDDIRSEAAFVRTVRDLLRLRTESRQFDLRGAREGRIGATRRQAPG
ncbi:endonuclease domain-containing protein [Leifsonia poae]|uniref:endonuclease domain-containing protein n=1 Tax=Leifsonia poae TaxID=110933 RepID=UPI003D67BFEB